MPKVMIMTGHGTDSTGKWDCGSVYKKNGVTYTEAALMQPITVAAAKYLRDSGITVYTDSDSGNNKNVITGVRWEHSVRPDIYVSVHCDYVPSPSGVYPLYYPTSTNGKKLATYLNDAIKNGMGIKSRGIAKRGDLYELAETLCPAVILETGSIDDEFSIYRNKYDEYGKCIARAICRYFNVPFAADPVEPTPSTWAVDYMVATEDKDVNYYSDVLGHNVVGTCKGIYTIVEESSNGFGKLKSGAGWIRLSDVNKYQVGQKTRIEKFCEELIREEPIIMTQMKYSNDDGNCKTWEDALKYKKCNCAKYISYALQNVGMLPKGMTFYWYHTKTLKPASAKTYLTNSKDWRVTYPNRVMKASELQVGDICGWHTTSSQHTTAICGKTADGHFIWASGGSGDMKNGMVKVRDNFTNHVVHCHIRYVGKEYDD